MNRFIGVIAVLICACVPVQAQDTLSDREIARAYLAAYEAADYDTMREYYTEDAVFIDPTSFGIPNISDTIHWQGADAIIAGISAWGVSGLEYTFDRIYESSGRVIFDGATHVIYSGDNGDVIYNYPIITIITVENGLVVEHRDYTDFAGATQVTDQ
jgi:ketosteroid isomerase-like protein